MYNTITIHLNFYGLQNYIFPFHPTKTSSNTFLARNAGGIMFSVLQKLQVYLCLVLSTCNGAPQEAHRTAI
ncbi:MAG TPA: hypothetical protein PKV76_01840, partial [Chitinophagales bacterium]|nr:hypothetical protein [Chitinophagales bacterium]